MPPRFRCEACLQFTAGVPYARARGLGDVCEDCKHIANRRNSKPDVSMNDDEQLTLALYEREISGYSTPPEPERQPKFCIQCLKRGPRHQVMASNRSYHGCTHYGREALLCIDIECPFHKVLYQRVQDLKIDSGQKNLLSELVGRQAAQCQECNPNRLPTRTRSDFWPDTWHGSHPDLEVYPVQPQGPLSYLAKSDFSMNRHGWGEDRHLKAAPRCINCLIDVIRRNLMDVVDDDTSSNSRTCFELSLRCPEVLPPGTSVRHDQRLHPRVRSEKQAPICQRCYSSNYLCIQAHCRSHEAWLFVASNCALLNMRDDTDKLIEAVNYLAGEIIQCKECSEELWKKGVDYLLRYSWPTAYYKLSQRLASTPTAPIQLQGPTSDLVANAKEILTAIIDDSDPEVNPPRHSRQNPELPTAGSPPPRYTQNT